MPVASASPTLPPPRPDRGHVGGRADRAAVGRARRWARSARSVPGGRRREAGQILIIFTIALVGIVAIAGLLVDGGMAWTNRRMAQNGADVAALAAAKTWSTTADRNASTTAARNIASSNGFANNYTDCSNKSRNNGVTVNIPPDSGAFSGQAGYVEVIVTKPMKTSFSAIVGQDCWLVSARAVAVATSNDVATCNFCSLAQQGGHTLVLKNSATLRVDGDIYVDSDNGGYTPGSCQVSKWKVCGDAFDVFGAGGTISAKTISVYGGWETHDHNNAVADGLAPGCVDHPDPPSQTMLPANVCVHMPRLTDPLNDVSKPGSVINPPPAGSPPVAGTNGCPGTASIPSGTAQAPALMTLTSGNPTICPGTYYGGLKITGGNVTMKPGVYVMVGGGFQVLNSAGVDGRSGVLVYTEGAGSASQSTTPGTDLVPDPIPGHADMKQTQLTSSNGNVDPNTSVTFTYTLTPNGNGMPAPTGTVDFYDGNVQICSASPVVVVQVARNPVKATCVTSFPIYGTRAISAVYSGDTIYNPVGNTFTETVRTPNGVSTGPITITSTGKVDLYGPTSGPYAGLTLFQERASNLTVTLAPGNSHAGNCPGNFMWKGVPPDMGKIPDACGAIGGLQGTVYAANVDALVLIEASGMANLQIISGKIEVDSGANARFGFDASKFANSSIHLVE